MASNESDPVDAPCSDVSSQQNETLQAATEPSDAPTPAAAATSPQDSASDSENTPVSSPDAAETPADAPEVQESSEESKEHKEDQEEEDTQEPSEEPKEEKKDLDEKKEEEEKEETHETSEKLKEAEEPKEEKEKEEAQEQKEEESSQEPQELSEEPKEENEPKEEAQEQKEEEGSQGPQEMSEEPKEYEKAEEPKEKKEEDESQDDSEESKDDDETDEDSEEEEEKEENRGSGKAEETKELKECEEIPSESDSDDDEQEQEKSQHESPRALQVIPPANIDEATDHSAAPPLPPSPSSASASSEGPPEASEPATHPVSGPGSGGTRRRRSPSEGKSASVVRSTTVAHLPCVDTDEARTRAHSIGGRNVSFHGTLSAGAASASPKSPTTKSGSPKSALATPPPVVVRSPSPKAGLTVLGAVPLAVSEGVRTGPPSAQQMPPPPLPALSRGSGAGAASGDAGAGASTSKSSRMKVPSLKLGTGHHRKHVSRSAGQSPPMSARVPSDTEAEAKGLDASCGGGSGSSSMSRSEAGGVLDDAVLDGLRTERGKERPKHLYATLHTSRRSNRYSMDPRLVQRPPELKGAGLAQTMRPARRPEKGRSQLDRLAETLAPAPLAAPGEYETFPFDEPDTPATIVVRRQTVPVAPEEGLAEAGAGAAGGAATEEADTLVAGTMPKIVAYITAPAGQYLISVQARELAIRYFAACFKMHITPHDLFTMLESRFLSARDRATDPRAASAASEVQLNTLDIINEWVKCAFESDFKGNSLLLATVKAFLRSVACDAPRPLHRSTDSDDDLDIDDDDAAAAAAAAAATHRRTDTHAITRPVKKKAERVLEQFNLYESRSNIWANKAMGVIGESPATNPFLTSVAVDDSAVTPASAVLAVDPKEYARQLVLMEFYLFEKITPSELLSGAWTKKDAAERSPRIAAMTRFFNQKSNWAKQAIIYCDTDKKRHEMLKHFLKIAEALYEIADYNGMMIYLSAVNSSSISFVFELFLLSQHHPLQSLTHAFTPTCVHTDD